MATRSEWGRVSIAGLPPIAGQPIAGAEIATHYFHRGLMFLGRFFLPFIIFSGVLFWGTNFLGPIRQEAKAKTVIISSLAVTAGQFLVII